MAKDDDSGFSEAVPGPEMFEFGDLAAGPILQLTLFQARDDAAREVLAKDNLARLRDTVSGWDVALGGTGYRLGDRWAESGKAKVELLPLTAEGAEDRITAVIPRCAGLADAAGDPAAGVTQVAARIV
jgi:hypothetical protein